MGGWHWEGLKCEDFEDLYYIDTQEQTALHMWCFDGVKCGSKNICRDLSRQGL